MAKFDIWMEGYASSDGHSDARLVAENVEGNTFNDAVWNWVNSKDKKWLEQHWGNHEYHDGRHFLYGCEIYQTEEEARKAFG